MELSNLCAQLSACSSLTHQFTAHGAEINHTAEKINLLFIVSSHNFIFLNFIN